MKNLPLVTIGAASYNNARYLVETLESIKAQSYQNIELIIVDDFSTDDSVQIIDEWLKTYTKPYKFIKHESNMGVCHTCNDLLLNAGGKYISTIATDDIMLPDKISIQVSIMEAASDDVAAVYSDAYLIKEDSSPRYGWFIQRHNDFEDIPSGNIFDVLLSRGNFIPAMTLLTRMECFKKVGFFDSKISYEDYDMWLRLSKDYSLIYSDYVSCKYRIRKNSLSFTTDWTLPNIKIYLKHIVNPIAIKKLQELALFAFTQNNKTALNTLKDYKGIDKVIDKTLFYAKLGLPFIFRKGICKLLKYN